MAYTSQPRKSALTNQNAELVYKYVFIRPKKLSVAGVSENGRKKWSPLARTSISTSRNKVISENLDFLYGFHSQEKRFK